MARIPKIESSALLGGSPRRPLSRSGVNLSALSSAASDVASAASAIKESRDTLELRLAALDDMRHGNQAETSLRKMIVDWEANPENLSDESGHEKIHQLLRQEKMAQASGFKTIQGKERFESASDNLILSAYAQAVARSTGLKIQRTAGSMQELNQSSLLSKNPDHEKILSDLLRQADDLFGTSPESGARFKEQLVRDSVLGLLASDPDRAERLLSSQAVVDGPTRNQLMGQIEAARDSKMWSARQDHLGYVQDKLTVTRGSGGNPDMSDPNFQLETFQAVHGEQRGKELHARFMQDMTPAVEANALWNEMFKGQTPEGMVNRLNQYTSNLSSEFAHRTPNAANRLQVAEELKRRVSRSLEDLREKGPVAWLNENDPTVSAHANIVNRPAEAGSVEEQDRVAYADALLSAQKRMGVGIPSMLSKAEVDSLVGSLEQSPSPDAAMNVVAALQERFPDPEHLNIALSDLYRSKAPKALTLMVLNRNQPWLPGYSDALQNREAFETTLGKSKKLEEANAAVSRQFAPWARALTSGRPGEIQGYMEGLQALTYRKMVRSGLSAADAAEKATEELLGSELKILEVGERPVLVSKAVPDNLHSIVSTYRNQLDLSLLDLSPFEPLKAQFPVEEDFLGTLSSMLEDSMFPVMSPSGDSVLMAFPGDGDVDFVLKDKQGRPLSLDIEDLRMPSATSDFVWLPSRPGPVRTPNTALPARPRFTGKATNWPVRE